ncbi:MAG: hypothetical protein PUD92_08285 [Clostridiales bacterium]|nr:hypothetical protein [Clostridiales bacterium]
MIFMTICTPQAFSDKMPGKAASVYSYALNDEMARYGVLSTTDVIESIPNGAVTGIYPSGVIYADIINFDNNENPYLVIFRADSALQGVCADVYRYDSESGEAVSVITLAQCYSSEPGITGEFALGFNETNRYIIYNEYLYGEKLRSDYYTVINGTAYKFVSNPDYAQEAGIIGFNSEILYPGVDLSVYNHYLDDFFSSLKNASADSVTYDDIYEKLSVTEEDRIETVLASAARFNFLDIGNYATMYEYDTALKSPDADNIFYSITNLYDLGEEIYYVRFATNVSFYNYAILRRTDSIDTGYQILAVRTDSIPLSDVELEAYRNVYSHNKLLYKKAKGSIVSSEPLIKISKPEHKKPLVLPKLFDARMRKPAGFIGGGICLALIVLFWITMVSEDDEK